MKTKFDFIKKIFKRKNWMLFAFGLFTSFSLFASGIEVELEAENTSISGSFELKSHENASNGQFINLTSGSIEFSVNNVLTSGIYKLEVFHFNGGVTQNINLSVNNGTSTTVVLQPSNWAYIDDAKSTFLEINLAVGDNTISISNATEAILFDKFKVTDNFNAYYFSASVGNDVTNNGSVNSPWKSIEKASEVANNLSNGGLINPGDKLFFKSGDTFYGHFEVKCSGTIEKPIEISSYGSGEKPIISGSGGNITGGDFFQAISLINSSHLLITKLWVKNDRKDGSRYAYGEYTSFGIKLIANRWGGITRNVTFKDLKISDVFGIIIPPRNEFNSLNATGIRLESDANEEGLEISIKDVLIEDCYFTHVGKAGVWAIHRGALDPNDDTVNRNQNIVIRNNTFFQTGGSGVILSKTYNALVENNDFDHTGYSNDSESRLAGRGSGMWVWSCRNVIAQYNRSYSIRGPGDSYGMHIDFGNKNILYQYNYSEDSEGGFCEILGDNYNCTYRFNVSVNDGFRDFHGYTLWISGFAGSGRDPIRSDENYIYNNTIFLNSSVYTPRISIYAQDTYVYNNIFMALNGAKIGYNSVAQGAGVLIDVGTGSFMMQNNLFEGDIHNNFSSLASNSKSGSPLFVNEGGNTKEDYIIQEGSPVVDAGLSFPQPEFPMIGEGIFENITEHPTTDPFGENIDINNTLPNIGASNAYNSEIIVSKDSDNDGVIDQIDQCPNTPENFTVNATGCTELSSNNFSVEVKSETCPNKNNGSILIKAAIAHNYIVNVDKIEYEFSNELEVPEIPPGVYEFCIRIKEDETFKQCFNVEIKEGQEIQAKLNNNGKKTAISITSGTPPFTIFKNGKELLKTNNKTSEIETNCNDAIIVKSAVLCEGVFSERVSELFIVAPNPVKERLYLKFTRDIQEVEVTIYDIQGKPIYVTSIQVKNGSTQVNLPKNIKNGIYFIKIVEGNISQTSQFILYRQ